MRWYFVIAVLAIAASFFAPDDSQAQACGALADPNNPACRGGTGQLPSAVPTPAGAAAQAAGARPAPEPGAGQFVCAFFDARTKRCLTVRPNTKDYDSAVQTGIEAAMMGMQIQQDAIYRAGQMGVLGGFGGGQGQPRDGASAPGAVDAAVAGADQGQASVESFPGLGGVSGVAGGHPLRGQSQQSQSAASPESPAVACAKARLSQVEKAAGRPATPAEMVAVMQACNR